MKLNELINESEFANYYDEFIDEVEQFTNTPINSDNITMVQRYYGLPEFTPQLMAKIINKDYDDGSVEEFFNQQRPQGRENEYQGV